MIRTLLLSAVAVVLGASASLAQTGMTVDQLIKNDFVVVNSFLSPGGPGLFLQKKTELYFCLVAETPDSPAVNTRHCKPVH